MPPFRPWRLRASLIVPVLAIALGCDDSGARKMYAAPIEAADSATVGEAADPVLVGAGDIASCRSSGDEATARLLDEIRGTIFTIGDNAYRSSDDDPMNCFSASWGRHLRRIRPGKSRV